jgi:hypothetical protein
MKKERAYRAALRTDPRKAVDPGTYNVVRTNRADNPEDRDPAERCLGARLPDIGGIVRIVQSPEAVTIYHEAGQGGGYNRIIPLDGSPHLPSHIRQWLGDARGHWEGNTLVVDTTNFTRKTNFRGSRENLHLLERFTPIDADRFRYEVTIEDPTTWVRPWTVMTTMMKDDDKANLIFESTCHEGNYGLVGMMANTRAAEKAFKEGRGPDPAKMKLDIGGAEGLDPDTRDDLLREGGVRR